MQPPGLGAAPARLDSPLNAKNQPIVPVKLAEETVSAPVEEVDARPHFDVVAEFVADLGPDKPIAAVEVMSPDRLRRPTAKKSCLPTP